MFWTCKRLKQLLILKMIYQRTKDSTQGVKKIKVNTKYRRHTDPNGGYDQTGKRNNGLRKLPYISVCNTNLPQGQSGKKYVKRKTLQ